MHANWQKNLRDAILLDPLILVHGNVKDLYFVERAKRPNVPAGLDKEPYLWFDQWLALEFEEMGFRIVILYDPVAGVVALRRQMASWFRDQALRSAPRNPPAKSAGQAAPGGAQAQTPPAGPPLPAAQAPAADAQASDWMVPLEARQTPEEFFGTLYASVFPRLTEPVAVICRFTDRFLSYSDHQTPCEKQLSLLIQKAAMAVPQSVAPGSPTGRIALLFDLEGAIPQELSIQAPFARSVRIPNPSVEERETFFRDNHALFFSAPGDRFDPQDAELVRDVANMADGLQTHDMLSLVKLSHQEGIGLGRAQVKSLLDRFKFGTRENAWLKISDEVLRHAHQRLREDVKGQDEVIHEVVPTLIRAKIGMTDLGSSKYSTKPRGVFFFVGPTGVGKTELSKSIAKLIFGDESALIRFDMSEYSEEHQQARLIGAPPGYVGFDQGGQLTGAILEKPFSVVLFDEIEKAHGRILDKFLQILDDGRLTDGMGRTVYFSEAILIFTSNIGTAAAALPASHRERGGQALALESHVAAPPEAHAHLAEMSYDELCRHFRAAVKDFFVRRLGRPEILNRIGEDNILVFNVLKDEKVKTEIIDKQIKELTDYLAERYRIALQLTPAFLRVLREHPGGFERYGARGVRNLLSKLVMNPLAEDLFADPASRQGKTLLVDYAVASDKIDVQNFNPRDLRYKWKTA